MGMAKHEIVVADKHLPAWIYLHEKNQTSYIEPHWHSSIEISYTLSGSISDFFIAGQSYKTQPGRILVVNSAELHSIRAIHDPKQDPRALTIIFPYRIIKRYRPDIQAYQFTINSVDLEEGARLPAYQALQEKLTAIADLYYTRDHLRKTILLLEILELLLDHFLEKRRIALSDKQDRQQKERITDIKIYIEDNFRAELALEDIANASYLSKEHLARFFKEQKNITVIQYLNYVRAKHAYPLLLEGQMTATQVALDCGFSGLRTMDRALVKNYGLTSREIRKKAINQRP
jgi:AraC-like DNA-binding protein